MSSEALQHLQGGSYVISGPTNLGLVVDDARAMLIDSGNDKESGRKINKILKERGWTLAGIINTHSNADHIGGNDYLQRMSNCAVWAPAVEKCFIEHPELESSLLWGGFPVKEMRSKFFQAKPSSVTGTISSRENMDCFNLKFIDLPGHYFDMVGVLTEDHVLYLGDCMFGEEILGKYKIPFVFDVAEYKKTIEKVREMGAQYYVVSHGRVQTDVTALADLNAQVVDDVVGCIIDLLATPLTYDDILKLVCDRFGIALDYGQYALVGSTIRSFLSYLYNEGRVAYDFINNKMFWSALA